MYIASPEITNQLNRHKTSMAGFDLSWPREPIFQEDDDIDEEDDEE